MNQKTISNALTKGLLAGYNFNSKFQNLKRGSFDLKSSHFEKNRIIYHDEWTGSGGQEIVAINNQKCTRVYAGRVVDQEILDKLGISEKDVIVSLIKRIQELKDKTRLFENCQSETRDGWGYSYTILDHDKDVDVTTGKEVITYKNTPVFVHVFAISQIK